MIQTMITVGCKERILQTTVAHWTMRWSLRLLTIQDRQAIETRNYKRWIKLDDILSPMVSIVFHFVSCLFVTDYLDDPKTRSAMPYDHNLAVQKELAVGNFVHPSFWLPVNMNSATLKGTKRLA